MKLMKKAIKIIVMFAIGLTIGKLIHKHVCKKYTCEPLTTELSIQD